MEGTRTITIKVPKKTNIKKLMSEVNRLIERNSNYVSVEYLRKKFKIKKLRNVIKITKKEEEAIMGARAKAHARAQIA